MERIGKKPRLRRKKPIKRVEDKPRIKEERGSKKNWSKLKNPT